MCGEHAIGFDVGRVAEGSSPHVRGALGPQTGTEGDAGIIPACAGSTLPLSSPAVRRWDHPRMCGEHPYRIIPIPEDMGSSPQVRGALCDQCHSGLHLGIIPACAGSTLLKRMRFPPLRDHPRMCGEHQLLNGLQTSIEGSSPHVRGAHDGSAPRIPRMGIIPACAGSTCAPSALRSVGEGSSPHVRGAPRPA